MKFKVLIGGIGLKEVEAEDIDGAYVAAVEQFGCRYEDILIVWPRMTVGEYIKKGEKAAGCRFLARLRVDESVRIWYNISRSCGIAREMFAYVHR